MLVLQPQQDARALGVGNRPLQPAEKLRLAFGGQVARPPKREDTHQRRVEKRGDLQAVLQQRQLRCEVRLLRGVHRSAFRCAEQVGLEHGRRQRADAYAVVLQKRLRTAQNRLVRLRKVHAPQRAQLHAVDAERLGDLQGGLQVVGNLVGDDRKFHWEGF
jgi:hypothetical protein